MVQLVAGDGGKTARADPIAAPVRPGRDVDVPEAELDHLLRIEAAFPIYLQVGHFPHLADAPVPDPKPFRKPGQSRFRGGSGLTIR